MNTDNDAVVFIEDVIVHLEGYKGKIDQSTIDDMLDTLALCKSILSGDEPMNKEGERAVRDLAIIIVREISLVDNAVAQLLSRVYDYFYYKYKWDIANR